MGVTAKINDVFTPLKRAQIIKFLKLFNIKNLSEIENQNRLYFINMVNPHFSVFCRINKGTFIGSYLILTQFTHIHLKITLKVTSASRNSDQNFIRIT